MSLENPVKGDDFSPGCNRESCPCQTPPPTPCPEFMGGDWIGEARHSDWCPRCSWHRRFHPEESA